MGQIELIKDIYPLGSKISLKNKNGQTITGELFRITSNVIVLKYKDGGFESIEDDDIKSFSSPSMYPIFEDIKKRFVIGDIIVINSNDFSKKGRITSIDNNEIEITNTSNKITKFYAKDITGATKYRPKTNPLLIPTINPAKNPNTNEEKTDIYSSKIRKKIDLLQSQGDTKEIIKEITKSFKSNVEITPRIKSSLYNNLAQAYLSIGDIKNATNCYEELIKYDENNFGQEKFPSLSNSYTALAKLLFSSNDKEGTLVCLNKAIMFNKLNTEAHNLLSNIDKIDSNSIINVANPEDVEYILEIEDSSTSVSEMLDIDIKEHKYFDKRVSKNGGIPTLAIADSLLKEALGTRSDSLTEIYMLFLEAAKAFSELNDREYDSQNLTKAIAFYARFKANSLYTEFRQKILNNTSDIKHLTRLRDSACDYYIESFNLFPFKNRYIISIMATNCLKLNIEIYNLKNKQQSVEVEGKKFFDLFTYCISSNIFELKSTAWSTIITIGAVSPNAWNALLGTKQGMQGISTVLNEEYYDEINIIEKTNIDNKLSPINFVKECFNIRKNKIESFKNLIKKIRNTDLNLHLLSALINEWESINEFIGLLTPTDMESKIVGDEVLSILTPYLSRNDNERNYLLIQVQQKLEKQISFIDKNTTKYGRTLFFPLYKKWKNSIQKILADKISQTLPVFDIIADPPYIVSNGDTKYVNLIIKNIGDSTAEGYDMHVVAKSTFDNIEQTGRNNSNCEVAAGDVVTKQMNLPDNMQDCSNIDFAIEVSAIYQGKNTPTKRIVFSVETEPEFILKQSDIPWQESKIPTSQLFKGRENVLTELTNHYLSQERSRSYILYGLTRTGKSSILKYLGKKLNEKTIDTENRNAKIVIFEWDFSKAVGFNKADEMWEYFLVSQINDELGKYFPDEKYQELDLDRHHRAIDFEKVLKYLLDNGFYPIFLVDEFSFIKTMMDKGIVNPAFLHTLRQYSIQGLASFIYAGTYDIKSLIRDPQYGITGQLVNSIEKQIFEIDEVSAEDLVNVIKDKLCFSSEAIKYIHKLSGNVPYFIQIICKNCAYYAIEKKRKYIGYPELENVVKILTGELESNANSMIKTLPENIFQNNLYNPADDKGVNVLISSIAILNKSNITMPRGVSITELSKQWADSGITSFRPLLADAIRILKEKKVLIQEEDEGLPVYKISVDLFRRWWCIHHPDIDLELISLQS